MNVTAWLAELRRRNVLRASALYAAAAWALAQGVAQLLPVFGAPEWVTRWIVIAAIIGFPFWIAFAWFYEFTPGGLKLESEVAPGESIAHHTGRKLDFLIIGVLSVAVVLLLANELVADKRAVGQTQATPLRAATSPVIPEKSIAVLPLTNDSGDERQQYFSDGLSEDFITALSQFTALKVIGRNSAFQFRESKDDAKTIGLRLGVAYLLEGSVRHQGDTVRISAQLIRARDGSTQWSQHYDRPYQDLFALQDEITRAVAGALRAKLLDSHDANGAVAQSDRPPSGNLAAYNAYLQGKFYYARNNEADMRQAIAQFDLAIKNDPRYALAYADQSHALTALAVAFLEGAPAQKAYSQARMAANKGLALDPELAAAYGARGFLLLYADFDWTGARAAYQQALRLAPNDGPSLFTHGQLSAMLGHPEQAVALTRQALATDPLHATWYNWLAGYLAGLGRLDEADAAVHKALALQPTAVGYHQQLTLIDILRGDATAALAAAHDEPPGVWHGAALAMAQQLAPDDATANAALQHLIGKYASLAPYQIAQVYALRREPKPMFAWLERAAASHDPGISYLLYDPFILRYLTDPRFTALCQQVGLPNQTTDKAMP